MRGGGIASRVLTLPRHPESPVVPSAPPELRPNAVAPPVGPVRPLPRPLLLAPEALSPQGEANKGRARQAAREIIKRPRAPLLTSALCIAIASIAINISIYQYTYSSSARACPLG